MQQLAEINRHNRKRQHTQQYDFNNSKEDSHLRLAANNSKEEDVGNT